MKINRRKIKKHIGQNKLFYGLLLMLGVVINLLVPSQSLSMRGLKLLNEYELPRDKIAANKCMEPYDVGDGVITFGAGITYPSETQGLEDINRLFKTDYTLTNDCVKTSELEKLQKEKLAYYEQLIVDYERENSKTFSQTEFDGVFLLIYNSPQIIYDEQYKSLLMQEDITVDEYFDVANNYYKKLNGYDMFGAGWRARILDSAQLFCNGDYKYQK